VLRRPFRRDIAALDAPSRVVIEQQFGLVYEARSGLIALLIAWDWNITRQNVIARKLDAASKGLHRSP
jgi:hypothetical protein